MQVRSNPLGGLRVALCAGMMALGLACTNGNQRSGNMNEMGGEGGDSGSGGKDAKTKTNKNTQTKAYLGGMKRVVPSNAAGTKLITVINLGKIPEKRPNLPAPLIKLVSD